MGMGFHGLAEWVIWECKISINSSSALIQEGKKVQVHWNLSVECTVVH